MMRLWILVLRRDTLARFGMVRIAVLPSRTYEKVGEERGFDIYDLLEKAEKNQLVF